MEQVTTNPTNDHGNILVVDDDSEIRLLITKFLQRHGYYVYSSADAVSVLETLKRFTIDAIILDVMLPGKTGIEACRQIRQTSPVPVILLTARSEEDIRVSGLEGGADDYITKPFSPRELLARLRSVLRRARNGSIAASTATQGKILFDGWTLDTLRRELTTPGGVLIDLSTGEYNLLVAFLEHANRVLSREMLMELAKTRTSDPFDRTIDVQISRLRRKLETSEAAGLTIKTVRGAGYLFVPKVTFG
ncbi:response regulator transcription factor [Rhabdaerophilum sp. SD176]|uniref:response regulator n=1 Tax=Rhabdaerophilum sp. SD176 TaxID=2983548 RepID=UPI0024E00CD1|nr:response regulator transcription factor [Rhabdaerophilum sp. SD176]